MDIVKVQKVVRKAVKDYEIKSNLHSEETLVQFMAVDLLREMMTPDVATAAPSRPANRNRRNDAPVSLVNSNE